MTLTARRLLFIAVLSGGCTPAELNTTIDASALVAPDAADAPAAVDDVARPLSDAAAIDSGAVVDAGSPPDARGADAATDATAVTDAPGATDVSAVDGGTTPIDVGAVTDAGAPSDVQGPSDTPPPRDAPTPTDVAPATDSPPPRDAPPPSDVTSGADAGGPRDAGCAGTARILAPTAGEVIETCSESGAAVFYDFRVEVMGDVASVTPRWRTPGGELAPSPDLSRTMAPWVFRRQVGGPASGFPALGVFPDALRGTWRFEVRVQDRCGAETVVSQNFQLTFTNRRCPNP